MNREVELQWLSQADHQIAVAERAVRNEMLEVEKLRRGGHDTAVAEKLLNGYEHRLQVLKNHRVNIVRFIEQIDQGLA